MTTTVGHLLDLLHEQAWLMAGNPATNPTTAAADGAGIRLAWERLARYTTHVLRALPTAPEGRTATHCRIMNDTLEPLRSHPTTDTTPEPGLMKMSVLLGGIADLVTSPPASPRPVDDVAAEGLLTSVLAAVHCAARWSIPRLDAVDGRRFATLSDRLRQVMVVTEPFAAVPPGQRASTLEDLAITSPIAAGLDGALLRWHHAAVDLLESRYRPTSTAFQTLASDQATLMAAASAALRTVNPDALANPSALPQAVSALRGGARRMDGPDRLAGGPRPRRRPLPRAAGCLNWASYRTPLLAAQWRPMGHNSRTRTTHAERRPVGPGAAEPRLGVRGGGGPLDGAGGPAARRWPALDEGGLCARSAPWPDGTPRCRAGRLGPRTHRAYLRQPRATGARHTRSPRGHDHRPRHGASHQPAPADAARNRHLGGRPWPRVRDPFGGRGVPALGRP